MRNDGFSLAVISLKIRIERVSQKRSSKHMNINLLIAKS